MTKLAVLFASALASANLFAAQIIVGGVDVEVAAVQTLTSNVGVLSNDVVAVSAQAQTNAADIVSLSNLVTTSYVPYTGATTNLNLGDKVITSADAVKSIDPNTRILYDATGVVPMVDWAAMNLLVGPSAASVDWGAYLLNDVTTTSVDWSNRYLYDATGTGISVDWANHYLNASDGSCSADWANRLLYDASDVFLSADWGSRYLYDTASALSADWANRYLYDSLGTYLSANWNSRYLYASDGNTVNLNWSTVGTIAMGGASLGEQDSFAFGYAATAGFSCIAMGTGAWASDNNSWDSASVSIGNYAGNWASGAHSSVFVGENTGQGASSSFSSIFLGHRAGNSAGYSDNSVIIGNDAGSYASGSSHLIAIGSHAGDRADYAPYALLLGSYAGSAANAPSSGAMANKLVIDQSLLGSSTYRASVADIEANAMFYGTFADAAANQTLRINVADFRLKGYVVSTTDNYGAVDPNSRLLAEGANFITSVDWGNRQLKIHDGNNGSAPTLDWLSCYLYANDGTTVNLDWSVAGLLNAGTNAVTAGAATLGTDGNTLTVSTNGVITLSGLAKYERHIQIIAKADGIVANQPAQVDFFTAGGLQYTTSGAKNAFAQWEVPDDWDGGNCYIEIDWIPDSGAMTGADAVKWDIEYRSIAEGEALNNGTSVTVTSTNTNDNAQYTTIHTRFTLDPANVNQPLTAQDHMYFRVTRDTGVSGDWAGSATVLAYEVIYTSKGLPTSN